MLMWPKLMGSILFHNVVRFTVLLAYSHTVTTSLAYIITGKPVHISNEIPVYICKNTECRADDYLGRENGLFRINRLFKLRPND